MYVSKSFCIRGLTRVIPRVHRCHACQRKFWHRETRVVIQRALGGSEYLKSRRQTLLKLGINFFVCLFFRLPIQFFTMSLVLPSRFWSRPRDPECGLPDPRHTWTLRGFQPARVNPRVAKWRHEEWQQPSQSASSIWRQCLITACHVTGHATYWPSWLGTGTIPRLQPWPPWSRGSIPWTRGSIPWFPWVHFLIPWVHSLIPRVHSLIPWVHSLIPWVHSLIS